MLTRKLLALAVLGAFTFPSSAEAQVTITDLSGVWTSASIADATTLSGIGTNQIFWGEPASLAGQSSYLFDPTTTPFDVAVGDLFALGVFTHLNRPILPPSITGATLEIEFEVGDAVPSNFVQAFDFFHLETPNGDDPCADGGANGVGVNENGCADRVTFDFAGGIQNVFVVNGTRYALELSGFVTDLENPTLLSEFWTSENAENPAILAGRIVEVPEPGSLALLATGMFALVGVARRRTS